MRKGGSYGVRIRPESDKRGAWIDTQNRYASDGCRTADFCQSVRHLSTGDPCVGFAVAAIAALIQGEGIFVGLFFVLAAMAFIVFAFGMTRVSLFADEQRVGSRSLLGTRQCSRQEISTIQTRASSLYFRRADGTTALTCGFYLFRAGELRRFAAYLGLPLVLPPWCR